MPILAGERGIGTAQLRFRYETSEFSNVVYSVTCLAGTHQREGGIHHVGVRRAHALQEPFVDLQGALLKELRGEQRGIGDRDDLVVAVHDERRHSQNFKCQAYEISRRTIKLEDYEGIDRKVPTGLGFYTLIGTTFFIFNLWLGATSIQASRFSPAGGSLPASGVVGFLLASPW